MMKYFLNRKNIKLSRVLYYNLTNILSETLPFIKADSHWILHKVHFTNINDIHCMMYYNGNDHRFKNNTIVNRISGV